MVFGASTSPVKSVLKFNGGRLLIHAFNLPGAVSLSYQKGLAGFYCICSAYCLFRTSNEIFFVDMFGWFEVVLKNVIKLLAVSK